LLAQGVDARPAAQQFFSQRLPLHLVEASLKLILRVLPLRVDGKARADDADRKQRIRVDARELERGDGLRQRHNFVGQGVGRQDARNPQRHFAELLEQVSILPQPTDQPAQVADERLEVILELRADVLTQVVELAAQRAELAFDGLRGRRMRALDLGAFAHHRVVAGLLFLGLSQGAAELKLCDLRLFLEVDEQPQRAQAARGARFDGHHDRLEGLAGRDVLDRGGVLGELGQALRLREFQIGYDQPLNRVRRLRVLEADFFDGCHLPGCRNRSHAVGVSQRFERSLGFGILGGHHDRADGEILGPGERALDGVGQ
jgi:hypothetical protein